MSELEWLQMEQEKEMIMAALNESLRVSSLHSSSCTSLGLSSTSCSHDSIATTSNENGGGGFPTQDKKRSSEGESGIPDGMSELEWLQMEQEKEMIMAAMRESLHISSSSSSGLMQQQDQEGEQEELDHHPSVSTTNFSPPVATAQATASKEEEYGIPNGMSELEWLQMEQEKEMVLLALNESMNSMGGSGSNSQLIGTTNAEDGNTQKSKASLPRRHQQQTMLELQHQHQQQLTNRFHPDKRRSTTTSTPTTVGGRRSSTGTLIRRPGAVGVSNVTTTSSSDQHKEWQAKMNAKLHNFKVVQKQQSLPRSSSSSSSSNNNNNNAAAAAGASSRATRGYY